jgi:Na+/H+-dicarboxylate symporter
MRASVSIATLAALVAGFGLGLLLAATGGPWATTVSVGAETVGQLWLNGLRMTVVPLVFALLVTGIAGAVETATAGRLAARSIAWFAVLLIAAATLSAVIVPPLLAAWPVAPDAAAALRAGAGSSNPDIPLPPPFREWLAGIIPVNPFAAASEGAILPLVVFGVAFGFAIAQVDAPLRAPVVAFFDGIVAALLTIVRWVLWLAPFGVFGLAVGVGRQGGLGAVGAVAHYLLLMCVLGVVITLAAVLLARVAGRVPFGVFARAAAPSQVVAFTTQSSLASLPAMLDGARTGLGIPARTAALVLPLAVSLFRFTSPPFNLAVALFIAHVNGIEPTFGQLVAAVGVAAVTNLSVVGLPSQLTFFNTTVPISMTLGAPVEILALLIAVELIPDLFRTVGNVTADLAVTAALARRET